MIYVGERPATLVRGDYEPAELYAGQTKIAGWQAGDYTGREITAEDTYNDRLSITARGEHTQDEEPSPDNPVEIEAVDTLELSVNDVSRTLPFSPPLYGADGVYDTWENDVVVDGVRRSRLTRQWKRIVLDGTETWFTWGVNYKQDGITGFYLYISQTYMSPAKLVCTHLPCPANGVWGGSNIGVGLNGDSDTPSLPYISVGMSNEYLQDVTSNAAAIDSFKSFLAAQFAAGTPVIVVYRLKTPEVTLGDPVPLRTSPHSTVITSNAEVSANIKTAYPPIPHRRFGVSGVGAAEATLTRLWDAVGMSATPSTDTIAGHSDFDAYIPFNRRKCVGKWSLVNGKAVFAVNAYYGDPDYTEDGTNGDYVAVEVDPFYYFEGGGILGVSTHQYPGWRIHPVCVDYDGNIREHTYLPCYQVGLMNGVPVSLPGCYPENGSYAQLMTKLRGYSTDLASHVILEPSAVSHYEWLLYTIEFATQNCQCVMQGASSLRHGEDMITAAPAANKIVMAKSIAQNYVVGQTIGITTSIWDNPTAGTAYCQIMALELCDEDGTLNEAGSYYLVTYSGDDRTSEITIGTHRCVSRPWICGATQGYAPGVPSVLGHTGSPISNTSGKYPCMYRYCENPFGNQNLTSMDLFNVRVDEGNEVYHLEWYLLEDPRKWAPYATANPSQADLENPDKGFRKLTVVTPASSYVDGYISAEDADPNFPYVHVPVKTTGGSASTYMCDYAYLVTPSVVRSVRRGGYPYADAAVGFRSVSTIAAPSAGYWRYGGGLYFIQ